MHLGVIAAGDGLRLKEEGVEEPKPLVTVNGKTLLERILILSGKYGFGTCSLIINAKFKEAVEKSLILKSNENIKLNYIFRSTPSSLHSLFELTPFLSGDSFCLMTIDSIFNESEFSFFLKTTAEEKNIDGFIAVTDFVDDEKPLWVRLDRNNRISGFSDMQENSEFVTGGIYFFKEGIIEHTKKAIEKKICRLRNFLQYLVDEGFNLKAYKFSKIIDVDHKKDIEEAEKFLKLSVKKND